MKPKACRVRGKVNSEPFTLQYIDFSPHHYQFHPITIYMTQPNLRSGMFWVFSMGAHTRLKSLKWNSLKMASLPSTSFHPTARRFGSRCSLSSVLSLWAFPAWQGKESEEQQVSVAEVGCSEQ